MIEAEVIVEPKTIVNANTVHRDYIISGEAIVVHDMIVNEFFDAYGRAIVKVGAIVEVYIKI